ncbi:MAG: hypothetical protein NTY53_15070 [Kiritimatiellaeota bacterium]|nr:hypothetical protein [Kiritimatiellota bacterium]
MKHQQRKVVTAVVLSLLVALMLVICGAQVWARYTCRESKRLLASAVTTNELAQVVGHFGRFFTYPDGSWMAVHCRDNHDGIFASSIVSRDSGGSWYESSARSFPAAQQLMSVLQESGAPNIPSRTTCRSEVLFYLLERPADLATARMQLEGCGLSPIGAP